jgi:hypothetical protein
MMINNITNPGNRRILEYLAARNPTAVLLAAPETSANPYYNLGSHPDIVERLWKILAGSLPLECRCIVHGTPALAHPATSMLFAFCLGTQYVLRLPLVQVEQAIRAGARTTTEWAGHRIADTHRECGDEWIFGKFLPGELDWLNQAFTEFGSEKYQQK